jgi:hypothetical protein
METIEKIYTPAAPAEQSVLTHDALAQAVRIGGAETRCRVSTWLAIRRAV